MKQEQIVLKRSARLNLDPGRGEGGDRGDKGDGGDGVVQSCTKCQPLKEFSELVLPKND